MNPAIRHRATEDEYLAEEQASVDKHEYVNGEVVAMAGASVRHNVLQKNLLRALDQRLAARGCTPVGSDQRVHVTHSRLYTYPDVVVFCGAPELATKDRLALTNPTLIVEILSASSEAYDRGAKFAHYQRIPSLKEYVLVSQRERRVDHFRRASEREWLLTVFQGDDVMTLPALGIDLPLAVVYERSEEFPADDEPVSDPTG